MLTLTKATGLGPVVDHNQGIAECNDLVFFLAGRVGAHGVEMGAGSQPVAPDDGRAGGGCRDDDISISCGVLDRPGRAAGDVLLDQATAQGVRNGQILGILRPSRISRGPAATWGAGCVT